jgi:hypothetical protein
MAVVVWLVRLAIGGGSDGHLTVEVLAGAVIGAGVYLMLSRALGVTELWTSLRQVRR